MLKYGRIAVTALSLSACVLLVAMWVRSYWWWDRVRISLSNDSGFSVSSYEGQAVILALNLKAEPNWQTEIYSLESDQDLYSFWKERIPAGFFPSTKVIPNGYQLVIGHRYFFLLLGICSMLPWLPWSKRFSLRTLLIATMLVAVGLGMLILAA
jgi:hypothetical protein